METSVPIKFQQLEDKLSQLRETLRRLKDAADHSTLNILSRTFSIPDVLEGDLKGNDPSRRKILEIVKQLLSKEQDVSMIDSQSAGQCRMLEQSLCHVMMDKALLGSLLLLDKAKLERQNHTLKSRNGDSNDCSESGKTTFEPSMELETLQKVNEELRAQVDSKDKLVTSLTDDLQKAEKERDDLSKNVLQHRRTSFKDTGFRNKLECGLIAAEEDKIEMENKLELLEAEKNALEESLARTRADNKSLCGKINEFEARQTDMERNLEEAFMLNELLERGQNQLRREKEKIELDVITLKDEKCRVEQERDIQTTKLRNTESRFGELRERSVVLETELSYYQDESNTLKEQLKTTELACGKLNDEVEHWKDNSSKLERVLSTMEKLTERYKAEIGNVIYDKQRTESILDDERNRSLQGSKNMEEQVEMLSKEKTDLRREIDSLMMEKGALGELVSSMEKQESRKAEEELVKCRNDNMRLTKEVEDCTNEISILKEAGKKFESMNEDLLTAHEDIHAKEEEIESLSKERREMKGRIEELLEELAELSEDNDNLLKKVDDLNADRSLLESTLQNLAMSAAENKEVTSSGTVHEEVTKIKVQEVESELPGSEMDSLDEQMITELEERLGKVELEKEELKKKILSLESENAGLSEELSDHINKVHAVKTEKALLNEQLSRHQEEIVALSEELEDQMTKVRSVGQEKQTLQGIISELQEVVMTADVKELDSKKLISQLEDKNRELLESVKKISLLEEEAAKVPALEEKLLELGKENSELSERQRTLSQERGDTEGSILELKNFVESSYKVVKDLLRKHRDLNKLVIQPELQEIDKIPEEDYSVSTEHAPSFDKMANDWSLLSNMATILEEGVCTMKEDCLELRDKIEVLEASVEKKNHTVQKGMEEKQALEEEADDLKDKLSVIDKTVSAFVDDEYADSGLTVCDKVTRVVIELESLQQLWESEHDDSKAIEDEKAMYEATLSELSLQKDGFIEQLQAVEKQKVELEEQSRNLKTENSHLEKNNKLLEDEINSLLTEKEQTHREMNEKLQLLEDTKELEKQVSVQEEVKKALHEAEKMRMELHGQLNIVRAEKDQLQDNIGALENKVKDMAEVARQNEGVYRSECIILEEKIDELTHEHDRLVEELQQEMRNLTNENHSLKEEVHNVGKELQENSRRQQEVLTSKVGLDEHLQKLEESNSVLIKEKEAMLENIAILEKQISEIFEDKYIVHQEKEDALKDVISLKNVSETLRFEVKTLAEENKGLWDELKSRNRLSSVSSDTSMATQSEINTESKAVQVQALSDSKSSQTRSAILLHTESQTTVCRISEKQTQTEEVKKKVDVLEAVKTSLLQSENKRLSMADHLGDLENDVVFAEAKLEELEIEKDRIEEERRALEKKLMSARESQGVLGRNAERFVDDMNKLQKNIMLDVISLSLESSSVELKSRRLPDVFMEKVEKSGDVGAAFNHEFNHILEKEVCVGNAVNNVQGEIIRMRNQQEEAVKCLKGEIIRVKTEKEDAINGLHGEIIRQRNEKDSSVKRLQEEINQIRNEKEDLQKLLMHPDTHDSSTDTDSLVVLHNKSVQARTKVTLNTDPVFIHPAPASSLRSKELAEKDKKIIDLENENDQLKIEQSRLQTVISLYKEERQRLTDDYQNAETQKDYYLEYTNSLEAQIHELTVLINQRDEEIAKLRDLITRLRNGLETIRSSSDRCDLCLLKGVTKVDVEKYKSQLQSEVLACMESNARLEAEVLGLMEQGAGMEEKLQAEKPSRYQELRAKLHQPISRENKHSSEETRAADQESQLTHHAPVTVTHDASENTTQQTSTKERIVNFGPVTSSSTFMTSSADTPLFTSSPVSVAVATTTLCSPTLTSSVSCGVSHDAPVIASDQKHPLSWELSQLLANRPNTNSSYWDLDTLLDLMDSDSPLPSLGDTADQMSITSPSYTYYSTKSERSNSNLSSTETADTARYYRSYSASASSSPTLNNRYLNLDSNSFKFSDSESQSLNSDVCHGFSWGKNISAPFEKDWKLTRPFIAGQNEIDCKKRNTLEQDEIEKILHEIQLNMGSKKTIPLYSSDLSLYDNVQGVFYGSNLRRNSTRRTVREKPELQGAHAPYPQRAPIKIVCKEPPSMMCHGCSISDLFKMIRDSKKPGNESDDTYSKSDTTSMNKYEL